MAKVKSQSGETQYTYLLLHRTSKKKKSISRFIQRIINPRSPWRQGIWGQATDRITKLSLFYKYSAHQLESREAFHTHFQRKKYPLWWDLSRPQLMHRSTRSSVCKCPPESAQPSTHTQGYPQTAHALPAPQAAAPRGSTNDPSTVNQPHPTHCK